MTAAPSRHEALRRMIEVHVKEGELEVEEQAHAFKVSATRRGIAVSMVVPFDATELFFEARSADATMILEDRFDYYGESEQEDFAADLSRLLKALGRSELRFTSDGRTVEYLEGAWTYLFGHFSS